MSQACAAFRASAASRPNRLDRCRGSARVGWIALWTVVLALTAAVGARLVAYESFTLRTTAMEPELTDGSWVLARSGGAVEVGDLAAVRIEPVRGPDVLVRRVVDVGADGVVLADAGGNRSGPHPRGDVVGPVVWTSRWPLDRYLLFVTVAAWLGAGLWWRAGRQADR